jgi:hypothetical protein
LHLFPSIGDVLEFFSTKVLAKILHVVKMSTSIQSGDLFNVKGLIAFVTGGATGE